MKTRIIAAVVLLSMALGVQAQKHEFANWKRYAGANKELGAPAKGEKRVVLMGNSITDGWPRTRPELARRPHGQLHHRRLAPHASRVL